MAGLAARLRRGPARELPGSGPGVPGRPGIAAHCPICGIDGFFPALDRAAFRESLLCPGCNATSRYRSLARGVLRALRETRGVETPALAGLAAGPAARPFRVLDTQVAFAYERVSYPIPTELRRPAWIEVEETSFLPDRPWGAELGPGHSNQTLEALTFPPESFDLVITSDVMEHVRLTADAHREIARVLAPGGAYVFTVPHTRAGPTVERVRVVDPQDPGQDVHVLEPEYHGDSLSGAGVLCYRTFGTDLDEDLAALGLELEYTAEDRSEAAIFSTELFYARKTGG